MRPRLSTLPPVRLVLPGLSCARRSNGTCFFQMQAQPCWDCTSAGGSRPILKTACAYKAGSCRVIVAKLLTAHACRNMRASGAATCEHWMKQHRARAWEHRRGPQSKTEGIACSTETPCSTPPKVHVTAEPRPFWPYACRTRLRRTVETCCRGRPQSTLHGGRRSEEVTMRLKRPA